MGSPIPRAKLEESVRRLRVEYDRWMNAKFAAPYRAMAVHNGSPPCSPRCLAYRMGAKLRALDAKLKTSESVIS